jgi:hypothetical protein
MTASRVDSLRLMDPAVLTHYVRQAEQNPRLVVQDWTVELLSSQGLINPEGLFLLRGQASDGETLKVWSLVVKTLIKQEQEPEPDTMWYWKREWLAAESGLWANLPGPVAAPRYYGSVEREDGFWLFMEQVVGLPPERWTLDEYALAARQLGRFNGAYLTGTQLPSEPWLSRQLARTWLEGSSPEHAWENAYVSQHFSPALRTRVLQTWEERERFYACLDRLPQVFSHFDFQRRNLLIRQAGTGQREVVAVDWALCGTGAVGGDLYALIGASCVLFEWEPSEIEALDATVFEAYGVGLREAGWEGPLALARLGYAAWMALHWGAAVPAGTTWWCSDEARTFAFQQFGRSSDEMAASWAGICAYCMDRADEARKLMQQLGLD